MNQVSPLSYALRLLKTRLRSCFELDQAMLRKGFLEPERKAIIEQLLAVDLLNDERFARAWVHSRDRLSPRGIPLLKMELAQKGLAKEVVESILDERAVDEETPDELIQAQDLIERRARQYADLPKAVRERRVTSFLMRRGFSYGTIKRILDA